MNAGDVSNLVLDPIEIIATRLKLEVQKSRKSVSFSPLVIAGFKYLLIKDPFQWKEGTGNQSVAAEEF